MPYFKVAGPEAKQKLARTTKGFQQRQVYRENLSKLSQDNVLEVKPEGDETIRKLKVNVRRAANELNLAVRYGETTDGTLLAWSEPARERTGRRGRPRKTS